MINKPQILVIVGLPGSGKSLAAGIMREVGWHVVSAGDTIRDLCISSGLETDRETLQKFGEDLLSHEGDDYFAKLLIDKALNHERVVIEGIRPVNVINIIKQEPNCILVYIDVNQENRFHRLTDRDHIGENEFSNIEKRLLEQQVATTKKLADVIIPNNGSIESFESEVKERLLSVHVNNQTP